MRAGRPGSGGQSAIQEVLAEVSNYSEVQKSILQLSTNWKKLMEAFEFASFDSGYGDYAAFICRQTGRVFWYSEDDADLNERRHAASRR